MLSFKEKEEDYNKKDRKPKEDEEITTAAARLCDKEVIRES